MNYPKSPLFIEDVQYKNYENAKLYLTRFYEDNIPVLMIGNEAINEVYAICNINPGDNSLDEYEFAIKDYSENKGVLDWLIKNELVNEPHRRFQSGFVTIPVCYASDKLKNFIKENCA